MASSFPVAATVKKIMSKWDFICLSDNDELYYYDKIKGLWISNAKLIIQQDLEISHPTISTYNTKEIINKISRRVPFDREILGNHDGYINVQNGMIEIETGKLLLHEENYYSITQLPIKYDDEAQCPQIATFISQILSEDLAPIIYEAFGFMLAPRYIHHKAFMFYGPKGRNGKTTLIKLIRNFIGSRNCSSVELQDFGKDIFSTANLFGKMVNIADDLSTKAMRNVGTFKQLTGESPISSRNLYQSRFEFINTAKMVFSCNSIPPMLDADNPFYERWIILPFENEFRGKGDDKQLIYKMTKPKELSGLLNIAIFAYKLIMENNGFSYEKTPQEIKQLCLAGSGDTVGKFIYYQTALIHDAIIKKSELLDAYFDYCDENQMPALENNAFFRRFKEYYPDIRETQLRENGYRIHALKGIKVA